MSQLTSNPPPPSASTIYHFAYGSNNSHKQMKDRCPESKHVGTGCLHGFSWSISVRGYANISIGPPLNSKIYGTIWMLSPSDVKRLDRNEGVLLTPPSYVKVTLPVEQVSPPATKKVPCLVYLDPRHGTGTAQDDYVKRINKGLKDAKLPEAWVEEVIRKWIPKE
ncbi:hypothetical protein BDZ91DRAFT_729622 [Kalaharituber pfeilii]|nr:hypothetical protein BDZ91DRAFT_729622 [Kalaharituber pfeilii]